MDSVTKEIFDDALYSNWSYFFDKEQNVWGLQEYMISNKPTGFTRNGEARDNIISLGRNRIARYLAEYLYDIANTKVSDNEQEMSMFYEIKRQEMFYHSKEEIIEEISKCMLGKQFDAFEFTYAEFVRVATSSYMDELLDEKMKEKADLESQIESRVDSSFGINNLDVNMIAINWCKREILDGTQIKLQNDMRAKDKTKRPRREYNLNDEMMAVTDIGNRRENQEDSVLILYHPENSAYKMMVVADGVGGSIDGQFASTEIVTQMIDWFESLHPDLLKEENSELLRQIWTNKLYEINEDINEKYRGASSTFVGAIVGEKTTTIASAGDSRAYILGVDDELYQMTVDDNIMYRNFDNNRRRAEANVLGVRGNVWEDSRTMIIKNQSLTPQYKRDMEQQKDNLRFHVDSNRITNCLGLDRDPKINFATARNDSYKTLMLFSDGVTDCLSDRQIMTITKNTKPKDIANAIVNEALTKDSNRPEFKNSSDYKSHISAGKDNTTAIVFDNTKEEER